MKMKIICLLGFSLMLSACSVTRTSLGNYNLPTSNIERPTKEGRVCNDRGGFLFSDNDLTVESARQQVGIRNITAIELEDTLYPFYFKRCVVVKGN